MKITSKKLLTWNACTSEHKWFCKTYPEGLEINSRREAFDAVDANSDRLGSISWVITRLLSRKDKVRYAIFAATLALPIFEAESPTDRRPRRAITAAKTWVLNPTQANATAAANAASEAADAAYSASEAADAAYSADDAASEAADAAYSAANAAAYAAYSADDAASEAAYSAANAAAYSAANAAAYAANAAAYAANAAAYAAAYVTTYKKIIEYGIKLLFPGALEKGGGNENIK